MLERVEVTYEVEVSALLADTDALPDPQLVKQAVVRGLEAAGYVGVQIKVDRL